jgi:hypothetical protein
MPLIGPSVASKPPALGAAALIFRPAGQPGVCCGRESHMTIPNRIAVVLIAAFAPTAVSAGLGLPVIGAHLATGLGVLLLGMACFFCDWCGRR